MIPKLIEIKDLTPFKGLIIDVSKIPVTRYLMKKPCAAQFNMLPEGKFFFTHHWGILVKRKRTKQGRLQNVTSFSKIILKKLGLNVFHGLLEKEIMESLHLAN